MRHLADQLFADMFENSSTEEQKILYEIAKSKVEFSLKELAGKIGKGSVHLGSPLTRLVERNCLRRVGRGKYHLFHSLFGEYVLGIMNSEN